MVPPRAQRKLGVQQGIRPLQRPASADMDIGGECGLLQACSNRGQEPEAVERREACLHVRNAFLTTYDHDDPGRPIPESRPDALALYDMLARLLDQAFRVPGTSWRF